MKRANSIEHLLNKDSLAKHFEDIIANYDNIEGLFLIYVDDKGIHKRNTTTNMVTLFGLADIARCMLVDELQEIDIEDEGVGGKG